MHALISQSVARAGEENVSEKESASAIAMVVANDLSVNLKVRYIARRLRGVRALA
jgi:hypothetical protein